MTKCGLLGKNIAYSKSPDIHNEYYWKNNAALNYEIFDICENQLPCFIEKLKEEKIVGFNVTIPYKEVIIKYLNELKYPADRIKAVNTVLVKPDSLVGFNTDYYGFIRSIKEQNLILKDKNALVLGNGGAARCIAAALKDLNCASIDIAARNTDKSNDYFSDFCQIIELDKVNYLEKYDIIVNCTPLGSKNYIDTIPICIDTISTGCIVYDLIYNPAETLLLREAKKHDAVTINGESMLKYQAYKAADIWLNYLSDNK